MIEPVDLDTIRDFAIALLIGALIGVEREKRKSDGEAGIGGLRTFILVALVGAAAGYLSAGGGVPWLVVATILAVTSLVLVGYWLVGSGEPGSYGLTTELAAIAVCLLGAMTM
ncbi:MAG: MgtC/SapB family protein, partial [Geminicoccaceae bacterium]